MITLAASGTISGVAGTAAVVTYTLTGDEKTTVDGFGVLAQGQLPSSIATLYTVPASTAALVQRFFLVNTSASAVAVTLAANGTAAGNRIASFTIPASGMAIFVNDGWKIYDGTGALVTTAFVNVTVTGDATGTGPSTGVPLTLATVNANVGSFGTASSVMTQTVNAKGLTTAAANVAIQIAESQVTNLVADLAAKQPTGNYITGTTGDVVATGPGSVPAVLATVNANVGSFGSATQVMTQTVNAKGLTTASANVSIQIAESQVTNLVTDLAGKQPTGNYITEITGDIAATGPGSVAGALATVNANVGSFGSATAVGTFTVNAKGLTTAAASTSIQIATSQVTGFDTQVRTSRLDQMAAPTAPVSMGSQKITTMADGTNANDAVTLQQLQASVEGRKDKDAVEWSTTGNVTLSGLGTQGNGEWSGTLTAGDRILAKDQSTSADKGIYAAAAGAWTRTLDGNTGAEITGATVLIKQGATLRGDTFRQSATVATIGTDPQTWVQIGEGDPITLASVGASPNAQGASLSGQALTLQPANGSFPGLLVAADFTKLAAQSGTNTGDVTLAAVGASPNANAASLAGQALTLQPASASFPGVITSAQFVVLNNTSGTNSGNVTLAAVGASPNANGATLTGQALNLELASASQPGLLTAAQFTKLANTSGTNTGDQTLGSLGAVPTSRLINTTAPLTGGGDLTADRTLAISAATTTVAGSLSAAEKIQLNSINGQNSSLAAKRVFRPGDYMVGNTYDPTGSSDSTSSFTAMMTAVNALNDRCVIALPPGVFKVDANVLSPTSTAPITIVGAGRGVTVLIPNSGSSDFMRLPSGADGVQISDFAIYNTSGTPFTANSGVLTNNCDSVTIERMLFVDLFRDVQVSGVPYSAVLNGTTAITGVSPALTAGDVGRPVSGPGIVPGTTLAAQAGTSGTLSLATSVSSPGSTIFIGNTIKCSIQKTLHSQGNGSATSVGVYVNNGLAGDTYIGPDVVMSNTGNTRRRACVELVESGHYEITQCNLTGSQNGVLIDPSNSQIVAFGFHTAILCDSNTINGMQMWASATTSTIKNIKSVNSWYSGTTVVNASAAAAGAQTFGPGAINGVTFTGDRFLNNRTHGFQHALGTDFRWEGCDSKGNSSAGSAISDGLNVAAGVGNFSVAGGKWGGTDTVPTAGNQRYGIFVAAGAGDNIKIAADDLTGNVTGPLSMGATGASVFVNGCPGLASPYFRGASSAAITTTATTLGNMLVPKNSTRITTTYRATAWFQQSAAGLATFAARIGATNDAVGSAATNAVIVSAVSVAAIANGWGKAEFLLTLTAIGASGNIQGNGAGQQGNAASPSGAHAAFGTVPAARASGVGFLAVDTTADRYLTISGLTSTGNLTVHNTTIEVVNY